ncbi:MAG: hypothetical protein L6R45_33335 [Anaerolineae bacterium]|nr:hypothetical protein [Anaerolineae bacterium]
MNTILKSHLRLWLILVIATAALLTLAFQGGETDPAHCRSCKTPTPTYTPTTLPPQACQVVSVEFDKAEYLTGDPIKVTLRVEDAEGAPLIGANVDATVSRQPFTDTLEASDIPPLEDQSGTYDGIYTQTNLPGLFTFNFDVSDFTGPRFLPCSATRTVRVNPKQCRLEITPSSPPYTPNQPITITAKVKVEEQDQCDASVNYSWTGPDFTTPVLLPFKSENCAYTHTFTPTKMGNYTFTLFAGDSASPARYQSCSDSITFPVQNNTPPCSITLQAAPNPATLNRTINLTATVTNTNGVTPVVTATVQKPNNSSEQIPLTCTNSGLCTGSYTPTVTGTHTFSASASDPQSNKTFSSCNSATVPVLVEDGSGTATVSIVPSPQTVDLCGRTDPDISNTVVATVTNLSQVDLSITYDSTFVIPSEITPVFGSGTISRNGNTIRYQGSSNAPVSGAIVDLLNIDWRLQGRRGTTTITLTSTLRDNTGASIPHTDQNGLLVITISPPCLRCTVNLQGRADHSGVMVTSPAGEQARSYPNGLFAIAATGELNLTAPGYLSTQMAASAGLTAGEPEIDACQVTLLAGDANGDNTVNILDLTYLAGRYQSADPTADLNASGLVDILDLALAAGNYQRQGQ